MGFLSECDGSGTGRHVLQALSREAHVTSIKFPPLSKPQFLQGISCLSILVWLGV